MESVEQALKHLNPILNRKQEEGKSIKQIYSNINFGFEDSDEYKTLDMFLD